MDERSLLTGQLSEVPFVILVMELKAWVLPKLGKCFPSESQ